MQTETIRLGEFEQLSCKIAAAMLSIQTDALLPRLLDLAQLVSPTETLTAFSFRLDARPTVLYDGEVDQYRTERVHFYTAGAYLLDPFYKAFQDGRRGAFRLGDIEPDDFFDSEYYRDYYKTIGVVDEVGFLIGMDRRTAIHISLATYKADETFSPSALEGIRALFPIFEAAIQSQWQSLPAVEGRAVPMESKTQALLQRAFWKFGSSVLTHREREIVRLTIQGHSAKSAARVLAIAPGTVMNHKRHVYDKLEITSSNALFSLFMRSLAVADFSPDLDPLERLRVVEAQAYKN